MGIWTYYPTSSGSCNHDGARSSRLMYIDSVVVCKQNEALNVTDALSAALPDICIIYRLHLECGRLINLYDWMQVL